MRIDLGKRTADILVSDEELATRREALAQAGGYEYPESQTPWQEIQRGLVDELSNGMVLKPAVKYQRIAETKGVPARQPLMGRFKYAYNSFSYYGEEIERSIERVARFGYDAIELVGEPEQYDGPRVRELATDAGIAVSSISSMYTADRDLCHPDPDRRRRAVDYVREVADLAAATGAATIIVAPSAVMKTTPARPARRRVEVGDREHPGGWRVRRVGRRRRRDRALEPIRDVLPEPARSGGRAVARNRSP